MIKYRNECCYCHTEGDPCNGRHKRVAHYYCDKCKNEWEHIYRFDGMELCENCVIKELEEVCG